jgi:hypothetical protein
MAHQLLAFGVRDRFLRLCFRLGLLFGLDCVAMRLELLMVRALGGIPLLKIR